jgi:hypothetical protein
MTIAGNYTLHFSWGGTNSYAQTSLTFNGDHTFSGSYTGKWRQQNGTVMLSFDGGPAKYGGTINGSVGSGVMSTFSGLDGTWYLSQQGTTGIALEGLADAGAAQPAGADGSTGARADRKQFEEVVVGSEDLPEPRRRSRAGAGAGSEKRR